MHWRTASPCFGSVLRYPSAGEAWTIPWTTTMRGSLSNSFALLGLHDAEDAPELENPTADPSGAEVASPPSEAPGLGDGAQDGRPGCSGAGGRPAAQSAVANSLRQPLVWLDLEMTGLDPQKDVILEIAVALTDGRLQRIVNGPDLVVRCTADKLDAMNGWCVEHHGKSGLTQVRTSRMNCTWSVWVCVAEGRERG